VMPPTVLYFFFHKELHGDVNNALASSSSPIFRARCMCLTKWHSRLSLMTQRWNDAARFISKTHIPRIRRKE
jgi:hypothetical protein